MIDVDSCVSALGITKAELGRRLGLPRKSNTLSLYNKGKSTPTFEMCVKLLDAGMSIEELFGSEIADKVVVSRKVQNKPTEITLDMDNPIVQKAFQKALSDAFTKASKSLLDEQ